MLLQHATAALQTFETYTILCEANDSLHKPMVGVGTVNAHIGLYGLVSIGLTFVLVRLRIDVH